MSRGRCGWVRRGVAALGLATVTACLPTASTRASSSDPVGSLNRTSTPIPPTTPSARSIPPLALNPSVPPGVSRPVLTRSTGPTMPAFSYTVAMVRAADVAHSWRPGCPVEPAQLRSVQLAFIGFDAAPHTGLIVVNVDALATTTAIFRALYEGRFPLRSLRPIDEFGGSDDNSMAVDNTSGFNCRAAVGGSGWSMHAYGRAIDVNPRENPYLEGGQVRPPQGTGYVDRSRFQPGMVVEGGTVVRAFDMAGWGWGGRWASTPDYQHFSTNGQ